MQKMKVLREVRYKQKQTFKKRQKTINKSDEEKAIAYGHRESGNVDRGSMRSRGELLKPSMTESHQAFT